MKLLLSTLLLTLTTKATLAQSPAPIRLPHQPRAFVQSFYTQVVRRWPFYLAQPAEDRSVYVPYLSVAFRHRIDSAQACEHDYFRQHPNDPANPVKAPFAWSEAGLFSGANEEDAPDKFHVEAAQLENNGSIRVVVRLKIGPPRAAPAHPWIWRVAAILIHQNSGLALEDVVFLKDPDERVGKDYRESEVLSENCNNGHWVDSRD